MDRKQGPPGYPGPEIHRGPDMDRGGPPMQMQPGPQMQPGSYMPHDPHMQPGPHMQMQMQPVPQMHHSQSSTTVVIQQPAQEPLHLKKLIGSVEGHREWSSGLFSCCEDCSSMWQVYCCLPYTLCRTSSRVGECSCMPWCVPGGLIALRTRIRTLGGIRGSICMDYMALQCCPYCVFCQMVRELDSMGL